MIDRIPLAHLPTPIQALPGLTKLLGGPRLFIKRDDLTGLGLGGNKTRKLEFLAADALAQEARMLISTGAPQSNHCRQVAAADDASGADDAEAVGLRAEGGSDIKRAGINHRQSS